MKIGLQELTQAIIAILMVSVTAWNVASNGDLPDSWVNMVLLVVGFYFGRAASGTVNMPVTAENLSNDGKKVIAGMIATIATLPLINWFIKS